MAQIEDGSSRHHLRSVDLFGHRGNDDANAGHEQER